MTAHKADDAKPEACNDPPPGGAAPDEGSLMTLWDWRRRMAVLYTAVRAEPDPRTAWTLWRQGRDRLFASHPQSPLDPGARRTFSGLPFFAYDKTMRFTVGVAPIEEALVRLAAGHDGEVRMRPFGRTVGLAERLGGELTLFWITGYGGGVFLPFADATSGKSTYGAGRYLLDTLKSADLGESPSGRLILDFNFAYNPSCCYSVRYTCPLAPRRNHMPLSIDVGEQAWPMHVARVAGS